MLVPAVMLALVGKLLALIIFGPIVLLILVVLLIKKAL